MQCTGLFGQQPLVDVGSNALSIAHTIEYKKLGDSESRLTTSVRNFRNDFRKRLKYLLGGEIATNFIANYINKRFDEIDKKLLDLSYRNTRLGLLFYSKKKERKKNIDLLERQVYNLKNGFAKNELPRVFVLLGEEINFYHDIIESLTILERQVDIINNDLNQSELNRLLLKK